MKKKIFDILTRYTELRDKIGIDNSHKNAGLAAPSLANKVSDSNSYLVSPVVDFLALGGASLLFLVGLKFWGKSITGGAALAVSLAFVVNHPHFAHSYQVFYRSFLSKLRGDAYTPYMRLRFFIAGVCVPIALLGLFAMGLFKKEAPLLGYTVNIMFALVGWHYVKQGYGALILCAVRRKQFFSELEKKILLGNALSAWLYSWTFANQRTYSHTFWGISYNTFALDAWIAQTSAIILAISSFLTICVFLRKDRLWQSKLPYNGITAYVCALYVWTAFVHVFHADAFLFIPLFHSLQYIIMVWKYEDNRALSLPPKSQNAIANSIHVFIKKYWLIIPCAFAAACFIKIVPENWSANMQYTQSFAFSAVMLLSVAFFLPRLFVFIAYGVLLGIFGFWFLPVWLQNIFSYDSQVFGNSLFLFMAWIFINVHHYFMDSVIWRKENSDVGKFLFTQKRSA